MYVYMLYCSAREPGTKIGDPRIADYSGAQHSKTQGLLPANFIASHRIASQSKCGHRCQLLLLVLLLVFPSDEQWANLRGIPGGQRRREGWHRAARAAQTAGCMLACPLYRTSRAQSHRGSHWMLLNWPLPTKSRKS